MDYNLELIVKKAVELHKVRQALRRWFNHGQGGPRWSGRAKTTDALIRAEREIGQEIARLECEFDRRGGRAFPGLSDTEIETHWMRDA